MKFTPTALALMAATAIVATASPALAQYGASAAPPKSPTPPAAAQDAPKEEAKVNVSNQARKEIVALQTAVNAKDTANIPAALAAAKAKAKTKEDNYVIAQLQLRAAADANNLAEVGSSIDAIAASGIAPRDTMIKLYGDYGKLQYNAKAYDPAGIAFDHVLQLDPNNVDAMVFLGESRNAQGRAAEGVGLIQKAIATRVAAGQKPEEGWYRRAVSLALDAKLPSAVPLSRDWVAAYPTAKTWHDTIRIYETRSGRENTALLDTMRLAYAVGALSGESDYYRFASALIAKGYPGEAKLAMEQGFASNSISKTSPIFAPLYASATTKSQGDRASLGASATAAKAAPDARKAMVVADAYYGYGDYAQAADLYRVALAKTGADKDITNLRLGMALARSGDKAGATAALNAVGGEQVDIAKLWLTYLGTKA